MTWSSSSSRSRATALAALAVALPLLAAPALAADDTNAADVPDVPLASDWTTIRAADGLPSDAIRVLHSLCVE